MAVCASEQPSLQNDVWVPASLMSVHLQPITSEQGVACNRFHKASFLSAKGYVRYLSLTHILMQLNARSLILHFLPLAI